MLQKPPTKDRKLSNTRTNKRKRFKYVAIGFAIAVALGIGIVIGYFGIQKQVGEYSCMITIFNYKIIHIM